MHQSESQYGVSGSPSLPNFVTAAEARGITCHALGISGIGISGDSTPSLVTMRVPARSSSGFEEVIGRFGEEEGLASEEGDRGLAGNRWPRQETLALLKIRSDMDATFRDSTLKGPLWENVSRKLAELGYHRTAKKCKEKFENVHKYYKRTKVGRAGRQDGKSYRFFTQLEALNSSINPSLPNPSTMEDNSVEKIRNFEIPAATITNSQINSTESQPVLPNITADFSAGIRFSSDSSSGEDCGNPTEDYPNSTPTRKRKRSRESSTKKILGFFENLMKQVIEKQEILQQRFLEAIEKREQDRMIREEAWRRQELTRLSREQEIFMQERSTSASKDAAVIAFLQKITGQTVPLPENHPIPQSITTETESPQIFTNEQETVTAAATTTTIATITGNFDPACSRWPKAEVQTLIKLRSELETKYQETGPKGPLWEEISSAMKQHGYNRSSKRCKEKWENINKYFKKVKESNKRRPEDAKTCPYYHQLDALYKKKMNEKNQTDILSLIPAPATDSMDTDCPAGNSSNPIFFSGLDEAKKPEDLVMEMVGRRRDQQQQSVIENLERTQEEEDDEEDGNDDGELCPKIGCEVQYDILTNTSVREVSSFMAMVQ